MIIAFLLGMIAGIILTATAQYRTERKFEEK